ncbi:serine hydrolase [Actinomadura mexicana]|uniref:Beta-lactamase class A n=1 Tax=Actinomadura mexicana TaxID=134959 RepID=A0A239FYL1_9ACTN|nr:serine hydrolase [Actinomadura mexicana]SNS61558.1 Beta-lactamase class A [Actinomadura mexicana]
MRRALLLAGAALVATAMVVAGSTAFVHEPPTVPTMTAETPAPRRQPTAPTFTRSQREELTRALRRYLDDRSGDLSISVREVSTGRSYSYGGSLRTATASIVKVDIVMALLLQAQHERRALTSTEKALADRAIKVSDNAAASELWRSIGGAGGLASANGELGLRDTEPGTGGSWGSTTTSAADQIRLLTALTSADGPLNSANRRYVRHLMGDVAPEQTWGVGAAGAGAEVKNGWLPRERHGGAWTVNSIGIVRAGDRTLLLAALSERGATLRDGVEAIEHACKTVAAAFARGSIET